ncbi:MAG: hypothetical protein U0270_01765 [Labilithrix sp.]
MALRAARSRLLGRLAVSVSLVACGGAAQPATAPPATSPGPPRFGAAALGATSASFKNIKKHETSGDMIYYRADVAAYEGIKLAALSYGFRDDRLATVRFELAEARDCARMLDALKPSFGNAPRAQPNAGRGTSYTWSGEGWTLRLNDFGSAQCNGIFFRP